MLALSQVVCQLGSDRDGIFSGAGSNAGWRLVVGAGLLRLGRSH